MHNISKRKAALKRIGERYATRTFPARFNRLVA